MERVLAHVEKVYNIRPIMGADRIEQVNVLGWNVITKKDEFKDGDLGVYIEIDSRVPSDNPEFEFLEGKGFKVKSMKMRNTLSQGLVLPISILLDGNHKIGEDVTDILGITKIQEDYEAPKVDLLTRIQGRYKKLFKNKLFKRLIKHQWFKNIVIHILRPKVNANKFPYWVVKTDEERVQNMPSVLKNKEPFMVTEKLDGTSTTFTLKKANKGLLYKIFKKEKYKFIICSRSVAQPTPSKKCFYDDNVYWEMALKYNVESVLRKLIKDNDYITLQGETVGETIQKNKYHIKGRDFYAFNLITEKNGKIDSVSAKDLFSNYGIKFVPIVETEYILPDTIDELMAFSTGKSNIYDTLREGYVYRNYDLGISFKCVSNDFLLQWGL